MKNNIESNYIFIIGGIKEHKKADASHINKYGIIHIIRQIDDSVNYPATKQLKEFCRQNGLDKLIKIDSDWSSRVKKIVNRELKKNNHIDSVQIEHTNGGLKFFVAKLIEEEWTDDLRFNLEKIKKLHKEYCACCYKLKIAESHISEKTNFDNIQF
jgi:hypothetical protein